MLTILLAIAGQVPALFWRIAGWLMPYATPKLGYALAIAGGLALVWGHGYMTGSDGRGAAVARCNLSWTTKLNEKTDELNEARIRAQAAAALEPATPADAAQRLQLCQSSPTCRERH